MGTISDFAELALPPTLLPKYPHMFERDIAIWERFLQRYQSEYSGFVYDWKVGSGTEPVEGLQEPYITMQYTLSKYRVDVIGVGLNALYLMEVKPSAATSALGQIIAYLKLFVKEYQPDCEIIPVLVTDYQRPDVQELADDFGVRYYVV